MRFTIEYIVDGSGAWLDAEHTKADCQVKFAEFDEVMAHTAYRDDPEDHCREVWRMINDGEAGTVKSYETYNAEREAIKAASAAEVASQS